MKWFPYWKTCKAREHFFTLADVVLCAIFVGVTTATICLLAIEAR